MRKLLQENGEQTTRSAGREPRDSMANCRVTKAEYAELSAAAVGQHMALSEWMREVALKELRRPDYDRLLLTELTGVRLLLTRVLRPLTLGEDIGPDGWLAILNEIRGTKHLVAAQVIEQYLAAGVQKESFNEEAK